MKESIISKRTFEFSLKIVDLYKEMIANNEYVLSKQLLRSATSIGANVEEALAGYSKNDFVYKMNIALKESRETVYWLKLIDYSKIVRCDFVHLVDEASQISRMLTAIIKTSRSNAGL